MNESDRDPTETVRKKRRKRKSGKHANGRVASVLKLGLLILLLGLFLYSSIEAKSRWGDLWSIDLRQNDHRVRPSRIQIDGQSVSVENEVVINADFVQACSQKTIAVYRFFDNRIAVIASDEVDSFPDEEFQRFKPALEYLHKNPMGEQVVYSDGFRLQRGAVFVRARPMSRNEILTDGPVRRSESYDPYAEHTALRGHAMSEKEHDRIHATESMNNYKAYVARSEQIWKFPFSAMTTADICWFTTMAATFVSLLCGVMIFRS